MQHQVVEAVKAHEFQRASDRVAAVAAQLMDLVGGDMTFNVVRYPVKPQTLEAWRDTLRALARELLQESQRTQAFQKSLAHALENGEPQ